MSNMLEKAFKNEELGISIVSKVFRKYYSDLQNQTKDNINYVLEVIKEEEKSKTTLMEKELYRLMKVYYTFSNNQR